MRKLCIQRHEILKQGSSKMGEWFILFKVYMGYRVTRAFTVISINKLLSAEGVNKRFLNRYNMVQ